MADPQGLVTFAGQGNILGGEMTFSRGVQPSKCLLRGIPAATFDRIFGTLAFSYGTTTIQFPDAACLENYTRNWYGRDGWRRDVSIVDRRWKWRYPRIDGVYNERTCGGDIRTSSKKDARELCTILLEEIGESGYDVSLVPDDVYPPCNWNRAGAALELQWICDLIGCVVVLGLDDVVRIKKLNTGSSLPAAGVPVSPAVFTYKPAVIPQDLRVQGDPTVIQSKLELEAVGLDSDGKIKPIANLSYAPSYWTSEWYDLFPQVAQADRNLAYDTVWRWFRPIGGWDGDGVEISDASQLELLEWAAESYPDFPDGTHRCVKPQVTGIFWPQCDHPINTPVSAVYAGPFRVIPELGIIEFEYPVISWSQSQPDDPELYITIAYHVRDPDGGYAVYQKDKAVSKSNTSTEHRVLPHPELTKVKIVDSIFGGPKDNLTEIDAEADVYLDMIESTYDFDSAQDVTYNGLLKHEPDGAIAQIQWWCGRGRPAMTRIGRCTEFDIYSKHHQDRRDEERLHQLAERAGI